MCSLHLTHPSAHLEQWAADDVAPGEQLGVRCLAQGSHFNCGQFLPEPRFEPTTLGYKSDALSIRPRLPPKLERDNRDKIQFLALLYRSWSRQAGSNTCKQQYPGQGKRVNKNTGNGQGKRQTIMKREHSRVQNTGKAKQDNENAK